MVWRLIDCSSRDSCGCVSGGVSSCGVGHSVVVIVVGVLTMVSVVVVMVVLGVLMPFILVDMTNNHVYTRTEIGKFWYINI